MIIVSLALIVAVANGSDAVTGKINVVSEVVDISDARNESGTTFDLNYSVDIIINSDNIPTGWKLTDCPISTFSMTNLSGYDMISGTDYDFVSTTGVLNFLNTATSNNSGMSNTTYASYDYCQDGYLNIAWGRSIMNLIAGFFALAILGLGLGLFYSVAKDAGIIGK